MPTSNLKLNECKEIIAKAVHVELVMVFYKAMTILMKYDELSHLGLFI